MPAPIILKVDVLKLRKEWFFKGQKGTYADLVLYENDQESQYGDSHVIKQNPPKELRDSGEKPVIVGNGKWMPQRGGSSQARPPSRGTGQVDTRNMGRPQQRDPQQEAQNSQRASEAVGGDSDEIPWSRYPSRASLALG